MLDCVSQWVWTWSGESFGWIDDDALFTHDGRHVGVVDSRDGEILIFALDGQYLGELRESDRLITRESRLNRRGGARMQRATRAPRNQRIDRVGRMMRVGYREFPGPSEL